MSKHPRTAIFAIFATGVVCAVAGYVYLQTPLTPPKPEKTTSHNPFVVPPPAIAETLTALFSINTTADKIVNAENQLSSLWFAQTFTYANSKFYAVFVKTQSIDPDSKAVLSSHADAVNVSAVVYQLIGKQWQLLSKQINIGSFGSWGDVPDMTQAQMLALSPNNSLFLMDSYYTGQGYTEEGKGLFNYNFTTHTWKDLGFIQTAGNNGGVCDDSLQPTESMLSACWDFTGEVTLTKEGRYPDYPNLLVLHKGTTTNNENKIVPMGNRVYVFDGNHYTQLATPAH
jgi:hypothetical protein